MQTLPAESSLSAVADPVHQRVIADSHERSRAFGLRAHEAPDLGLLSRADLHLALERNVRLSEHAMPVMELLWEQLSHTQSMVVLTDKQGTILHALGDAHFLDRAHRVALAPGAVWTEAAKGTNAVGTALMDEQPTVVHAREHYVSAHQFLTCSAAPIFDHAGHVLGVIDVSGDQRSYHPHTLALARMSARLIENQWFADRFRRGVRLHLHGAAFGLGTVQEGIVALDGGGRILGVNRCAVELLARSPSALRRATVDAIFGVSLAQMIEHARRAGDAPMTLVVDAPPSGLPPLPLAPRSAPVWAGEPGQLAHIRHAHTEPHPGPRLLYAKVSLDAVGFARTLAPTAAMHTAQESGGVAAPAPAPVALPAGSAQLPTLRAREIEAIRQAVVVAKGNMTQAAHALGIGRTTLYRKLKAAASRSTS